LTCCTFLSKKPHQDSLSLDKGLCRFISVYFSKKLYQGRYESFSGLKDEFLLACRYFLGRFLL
jgi:hypothetical protein